jgi:hypothetical protein
MELSSPFFIFYAFGKIFAATWWIFLPVLLFMLFERMWILSRWEEYAKKNFHSVSIEVKIPADIEKSPKIFEQVLSGFHGIKPSAVERDVYKYGKFIPSIALEIYGTRDQISFVIGGNKKYLDLLEAAIYSQYPSAEIKEIEHPLKDYPENIVDSKWDIFGLELALSKEDAYPIRTYKQFVDDISRTSTDPLASFLEIMGKLKPGETICMQVMIRSTSDKSWKKDGTKLITKVMGRIVKDQQKLAKMLASESMDFLNALKTAPFQVPEFAAKKEDALNLKLLSPEEKDIVESVASNIEKLGFQTKYRFLYISPKELYDPNIYYSLMGAVKQFNSTNLNGFENNKRITTSVYYFRKAQRDAYRKRRFYRKFRERDFSESGFIFNTEELATIYHFPDASVLAPLTPRVEAKKSEPPANLPIV